MKITGFVSVLLLIIPFLSFAGDNYNYDIPDFNRIEVSGNMTVILEKRSKPGMYIEIENSSIDDIQWYVSVKTLVLKKKSAFPDFSGIKLLVYYSGELKSLISKNGSIIKNIRKIDTDKILLEASSGGIQDLVLEADNVEARSVRTSRIRIKGSCKRLFAQADSGSEINSYDLACLRAEAYAHSGGIIRVRASQQIEGSSGLGSYIYYKGAPSKIFFTSGTGGELIDDE